MSKELIDALRSVTKPNNNGYSKVCTVDSVDLTNLTCYCVPINNDADIQEVRLMANIDNGFLLIPEVDSIVVVSFLSDSSAFISMVSKVSEIQLNGTNYGGLIKIDDLTSSINSMINNINLQFTAISAGISGAGGTYTPTPLTTFNKTTYENLSTKHGNGS